MEMCRNGFEAEVVRAFVAHNGVDAVKSMLTFSPAGAATATIASHQRPQGSKKAGGRIRRKEPLPEGDQDSALPQGSEPIEHYETVSYDGDSEKELDGKTWRSRTGPRHDATGVHEETRRVRAQSGTDATRAVFVKE